MVNSSHSRSVVDVVVIVEVVVGVVTVVIEVSAS